MAGRKIGRNGQGKREAGTSAVGAEWKAGWVVHVSLIVCVVAMVMAIVIIIVRKQ